MLKIRAEEFLELNDEQKCYFFYFLLEYSTAGAGIGFGANLLTQMSSSTVGFRFLGFTLILIGVALLIICCGSCSFARNPELAFTKTAYCSVPLLVAMATLGIFVLAVSSDGEGISISERSYKEYEVESYSKWMQNKVNDEYNWDNHYKKVVVKHDVCKKLNEDYKQDSLDAFHKRELSPFESGCCKPPEDCNFNYKSPTVWANPENETYSNNVDCNRWDNDPTTLCFDCQSCKAAFLEDVTSHWFTRGVVLVLLAGSHLLLGAYLTYLMYSKDYSSQSRYKLLV